MVEKGRFNPIFFRIGKPANAVSFFVMLLNCGTVPHPDNLEE